MSPKRIREDSANTNNYYTNEKIIKLSSLDKEHDEYLHVVLLMQLPTELKIEILEFYGFPLHRYL